MSHYPHVIERHIFSIRVRMVFSWFIFISISNVIFLFHRTVDLKYNISKCESTLSIGSIVLHTHYSLRKYSHLLQYFYCNRSQSFHLFACTSVSSALRLKQGRKGMKFSFQGQARNVGHQAIIFIMRMNRT